MWQQVKREYKIEDSLYAEATASHPEKEKKPDTFQQCPKRPTPNPNLSHRKPDKIHSTGARIPEKQTTFKSVLKNGERKSVLTMELPRAVVPFTNTRCQVSVSKQNRKQTRNNQKAKPTHAAGKTSTGIAPARPILKDQNPARFKKPRTKQSTLQLPLSPLVIPRIYLFNTSIPQVKNIQKNKRTR